MRIFGDIENNSTSLRYLWLWAMTLYVPLAACGVNADLFEARTLLVAAVWTLLLTLPSIILNKKWLYIAAAILLFLEGFANLAHWLILRCPISASSIFVMLNTNAQEASEFITLKQAPRWLLLLPYIALFVATCCRIPRFSLQRRRTKALVAIAATSATLFITEAAIHHRFLRKAAPNTVSALCSFAQEARAYKALNQRTPKTVAAHATFNEQVCVLIIGESCNRNHLSLYGYNRNTSPCLAARHDILRFQHATAPYSYTMASILHMLSESNTDSDRPINDCLILQDIFHSAGFKTYWLSNQSPIGVWDNAVFSIANQSDECRFVNCSANSSFESTQIASYDELLLKPLQQSLDQPTPRKFIVLHLMGSHSQYNRRYPADFNHFKGANDKRQKTIDEYDNSVLYNDFVVNEIFNILDNYAQNHPQTSMTALYLSDHGENVYDDGDYAGHDCSDTIPKSISQIPLLIWTGSRHPDDWQRYIEWESRLEQTFLADDLYHLMIDINNIDTKTYDPSRSPLNAHFDAARTRKLSDGHLPPR